jgi:hypothetical protein
VKQALRKYHRLIATLACLPLLLSAVTGIAIAIVDGWFHQPVLGAYLIKIHTLDFFGLGAIYPILNGLGLIGLIATGISMTGLFRRKQIGGASHPAKNH